MAKNIIDSLDNISKLIEEEKYQEAKNYIKKTKEEIETGKDAADYIDDLVDNLQQENMVIYRKKVEFCRKMSNFETYIYQGVYLSIPIIQHS